MDNWTLLTWRTLFWWHKHSLGESLMGLWIMNYEWKSLLEYFSLIFIDYDSVNQNMKWFSPFFLLRKIYSSRKNYLNCKNWRALCYTSSNTEFVKSSSFVHSLCYSNVDPAATDVVFTLLLVFNPANTTITRQMIEFNSTSISTSLTVALTEWGVVEAPVFTGWWNHVETLPTLLCEMRQIKKNNS